MSKNEYFYNELMEALENMEIIDTHEHLPDESERLSQKVDFYSLFAGTIGMDIYTAGASGEEFRKLNSEATDPEEKWEIFEPYYRKVKNIRGTRASHISIKKFYSMDPPQNAADAAELTKRIYGASCKGLYGNVIQKACNIKKALRFGYSLCEQEFIEPVMYVSQLADINSLSQTVEKLGFMGANWVSSLEGYEKALGDFLDRQKKNGVKGLKLDPSYRRPMDFFPTTASDAQRIFNRILDEARGWRNTGIGYEEAVPLHDYLVNKIVEMATELSMPVIFHTGYQTGHYHDLQNSSPKCLWRLFNRYRNTKFIMLHSGFPWVEEAALMAKHFPEVYLDMTWMHILSPDITVRALRIFIDTLPANKVLGFGGDCGMAECVYGNLVIARENIARALAEKTMDGAITLADAVDWCHSIMFGNAANIYQL